MTDCLGVRFSFNLFLERVKIKNEGKKRTEVKIHGAL